MNWLDILFVFVISWNTWMGLKTGLLAGASRLAGALAGLAAAPSFYQPLADAVNLKWNLVSDISRLFAGGERSAGGPFKVPGTPDLFYPGPAAPGAVKGLYGIGEPAARVLASAALDILCFIIIFLTVSWIVSLLGVVAGKIARIVFLGPVDRAGGAVLGAARGCVVSAVVMGLAVALQLPAAFFSGGKKTSFLTLALQKSVLAPYFLTGLEYLKVHFPGWIM
ncbi:MAG: CvpA family protein [Bacillota bacterium]